MMDIERINDHTVKFFITNQDIENRGFAIDEIWRNRQRGEQLLWEMLDEVQEEIDIQFDGTLKIQVNASDTGLEFIISNSPGDLSQKLAKFFSSNQIVDNDSEMDAEFVVESYLPPVISPYIFVVESIEEVIAIFKHERTCVMQGQLFSYQDRYYIVVRHEIEAGEDADEAALEQLEAMSAVMMEFGEASPVSIHVLEEYGNCVIEEHVYQTINQYF